MSVYNRISDRTKPWETVKDRERPYETVYTTAHEVYSTSELNRVNIAYKSYGIELEQKSVGPCVNPEVLTINAPANLILRRVHS